MTNLHLLLSYNFLFTSFPCVVQVPSGLPMAAYKDVCMHYLHMHYIMPLHTNVTIAVLVCLSVSVQEACTLLGVQNSELLRLICLIAAAAPSRDGGGGSGGCVPGVLVVRRLSGCLGALEPEVRLRTQQLAWALDFNKNMLLGEAK